MREGKSRVRDPCEQKRPARKRRQQGKAGRWEESKGVQRVPYTAASGVCLGRDRGGEPGRGTKRERQERMDDQEESCMLWPVNSGKT